MKQKLFEYLIGKTTLKQPNSEDLCSVEDYNIDKVNL